MSEVRFGELFEAFGEQLFPYAQVCSVMLCSSNACVMFVCRVAI